MGIVNIASANDRYWLSGLHSSPEKTNWTLVSVAPQLPVGFHPCERLGDLN